MDENMEVTDQQVEAAWEETEAADQPEEETQDQSPEDAAPDQPDQPEQPEQKPELFTIKNRDETRQVTRDELVSMAQKGWDYDKIRQERDQLRQYRQNADPALQVVERYARRSGMSVGDYLDYVRKQELISDGMNEQAADRTVQMEKERASLDAQRRNALLQRVRQARQERQKDFGNFLSKYRGVDPKDIPRTVWERVAKGDSLVTAYTEHENKRLQAEIAAMKQNHKNRAQAPGSLGGTSGKEMDEIDRIWAEED